MIGSVVQKNISLVHLEALEAGELGKPDNGGAPMHPKNVPPSVRVQFTSLLFPASVTMLQAIKYSQGHLEILDQLQLPFVEKYVPIRSAEDGWHAIKDMKVRGAPAIAIVATLALASELHSLGADGKVPEAAEETRAYIAKQLEYLVTSRPTAVNLSDAARKLGSLVETRANQPGADGNAVVTAFIQAAEAMMVKDLDDNQKIGHNGAEWIIANATRPGTSSVAVLTHCNTG
jgi:methylthioribose-1-phosphate isomerase